MTLNAELDSTREEAQQWVVVDKSGKRISRHPQRPNVDEHIIVWADDELGLFKAIDMVLYFTGSTLADSCYFISMPIRFVPRLQQALLEEIQRMEAKEAIQ